MVTVDVFNKCGYPMGKKVFWVESTPINSWINCFKNEDSSIKIGFLAGTNGNIFQHNNIVYIINYKQLMKNPRGIWVTPSNLNECSIYFAIRHCLEATWVNDRDQFLYPFSNRKNIPLGDSSLFTQEKEIFDYDKDSDFKNDCLIFTLFHNQNAIKSNGQPNNWIPFSPAEVHAKDNFRSTFMYDYIKKRGTFTPAAKAVLDAGRCLWSYYHETIKTDEKAVVDASLYEIREYFKGRNEKGKMNNKATDEKFNELDTNLRHTLKALAIQIRPKVYEYGFLKE